MPVRAGLFGDKGSLSLSPQGLWQYFMDTLSEKMSTEIDYLIVDGIDELTSHEQRELLNMFGELITIKSSLRILILSRDEIEISRALSKDTTRNDQCLFEIEHQGY